ncbi:RagB/SusD family nutrient uptake outer membrane protein [Bacteroides sp. Marseille-P8574]|uniref:RagB/SusD family nutrient uptake outer membrane protein n=1 Tax=Bacteroides sp. Marseille-P8574 TaxID=2697504 RepID=UPI00157DE799|nr:RagB/SusD family nutrient uptake outer membrane protein [Bacteroides sp. Marseille-P8574]
MRKIYSLSIALLSLLGVCSCDSYLDINPKQVLDENILNKPSDIEGFVTAAYARMCEMGSWDSSPYMYWWSGSMRSDDSYKGGGGVADAIGSFGNMSLFTDVTPNTGALDGTWYNSYQVIQRCNTAIQKMVNFTEEELPEKNSYMGEMLFIRSFTLYRLKKLWKYIPYIDENVVGTSEDFEAVPNHEPGQVTDLYLWQYILDDFKRAESLLPLEQEDKGRVSRNAATAMIARTMLNMAYEQNEQHQVVNINKQMLSDALPYIDKIIAQEGERVGLETDFGNNFLLQYDNATKESIWELQFSINDGLSTGGRINRAEGLNHPWMWPKNEDGSYGFQCCDFNHASYTMANAFKTDENGLPRFDDYNDDDYGQYVKNPDGSYNLDAVNSGAKDYFDKYTWDPRFSHTIVAPGQPWKYNPDLIFHSSASRDPVTYSYLKPIKELPDPNCGCLMYDGWQFNSMNKKMIRYDDVLLWKAEILIQLDREMEALPLINQIRTRAANSTIRLIQADGQYTMNYHVATYQPGVNCNWTKDYAWQALVWENRLEFACEGHRFFDLQRWGTLAETMNAYFAIERTRFPWFNSARFTAGRDEYFPISQPQMEYSKGNYTQNPGY